MKKTNMQKIPSSESIKQIADQISMTEFWSCVNFADITSRYVEITMNQDNISRLQGITLLSLVFRGGEMTPTKMAKVLFRSKHSMTKIIDSLEKEGLIIRDFSNNDRRVTEIKITEKGLEHVKHNIMDIGNKRAQEAMKGLNKGELQSLVITLDKMRKNMIDIMNSF